MFRFKFTEKNVNAAIKYLRDGKGTPPKYAVKFKDELTIKGKKLFYNGKEVIPRERMEAVMREALYKEKSDVPYGRDSAFHVLKQRYVGLPKHRLMEFIRKQKTLGEITPALNKPRQTGGPRLKNLTFETDLIFLRKTDLDKANKKFIRETDIPGETYFLTCVEKVSGLSNYLHVDTKLSKVVSPLVISQCEKIAKQLGVKLKDCSMQSDKGGEFNLALFKTKFKNAKNVSMGPHVEFKNRHFQSNFFKILRMRKADTIEDAMQQAESIMNNTFNRIQKGTPNEIAERKDTDKALKTYNSTRKEYIAGDKRKPFEVSQHVRILVKEKKAGIAYKTYKNESYSQQVYVIEKKTKTKPEKYRVNKKWYLQSSLLKSAPRDKISNALVDKRTEDARAKEQVERKEHTVKRLEEVRAPRKRPQRRAAKAAKIINIQNKHIEDQIDDTLDAIEEDKEPKKIETRLPDAVHKKTKALAAKAQNDKMSEKAKKLIRFLKKHGQRTTGNEDVLKYRVSAYKRKLKRMKRQQVKIV